MSGDQKISLYNVSDLKNTTDDALAPYLCNLPKPYTFKQQHFSTDVKLIVGYVAVTIAGVLFYADWKLGWDATKAYTAPACVAYFLLNGVFTYWIWAVEAGTVFVGVREGGQKLTLRSFSKKHSPIYRLKVTYEAPSGKKWEDKEVTGSYTEWFNAGGRLEEQALKSWLAGKVDVIGQADPTSKQQQLQKTSGGSITAGGTASIDDIALAAMSTGVAAPTSATKKSKRKT